MNPAGVIVFSALLSAAVAYGVARISHTEPAAPAPGPDAAGRSGELLEKLANLERSVKDLGARLDAAPAEAVRRPDAPLDAAKVAQAVREWLDAHPHEVAGRGTGRVADAAAATKPDGLPAASFDDILAKLADKRSSASDRQVLWEQAKGAGFLDRLVAAFEERAKANPNSPDAQVDLGTAWLQKLFVVEDGPAKGTLAMKADAAFDKALELDERHWDARFNKAVSLAFWPPVFGKQGEAIKHFETLLSQQGDSASRPEFAQTYIFLGNLYEQQGKSDSAQDAWRRGLKAFPDDKELRKRTTK